MNDGDLPCIPGPTVARCDAPATLAADRGAQGTGRPDAFDAVLGRHGLPALAATGIETLQINVGRLCNQTCAHCHVDAGPQRREQMDRATAELCLAVLARTDIPVLDVTGGAPEMNPHFRRIVAAARALDPPRHVIVRSNLTILVAPGFDDLPEFLAAHRVEVAASLPCYLEENVDRQRGSHVFRRSIDALARLNALGYGIPGTGLLLTLVYNPVGPSLPPPQEPLEADYRRELRARHGIEFTRLHTIANMPISRFRDDLERTGRLDAYERRLVERFNPAAAERVMCRTTLSVDWEGYLHDCDFNLMLGLPLEPAAPRHLRDFDLERLARRRVVTADHCFGCTAGAGSSCRGAVVPAAPTT